jgi:transposase
MEYPMPEPNDLSRSLVTFEQDATLVAVIEMSQSSWLIAGTVPGIERQPRKKITPDETAVWLTVEQKNEIKPRKESRPTSKFILDSEGRHGGGSSRPIASVWHRCRLV